MKQQYSCQNHTLFKYDSFRRNSSVTYDTNISKCVSKKIENSQTQRNIKLLLATTNIFLT